jgi:hypothetical protein
LADRAFASRDLGGLPLETRRAVNRWGELDGALFVVAEAQKERLKTVEDTNRLGAAFGVMTDADWPRTSPRLEEPRRLRCAATRSAAASWTPPSSCA